MKGGILEMKNNIAKLNWILLGLVMLVPGLLKLFVIKPSAVSGMLSSFGFPVPVFFAWVLIIAEIGSGVAILAKWKLKYVVWLPMIILLVATFTANWGNWTGMLLHLLAVSNYWMLGSRGNK